MSFDLTAADAIMKELYVGQRPENLVYKNNPLLALLPKMEDFMGDVYPLPVISGNPQNRSATAATALAGTATSTLQRFGLTHTRNYSKGLIDGLTIKASASDKGAFVSALTLEVDGCFQALANDIANSICRDSSGYKAQVSAEPSTASTTVITLKEPQDVVGFEIGQTVVIHSAKSGGSQRTFDGSTTSGSISAIDRSSSAATITVNTAYDGSGTIAADDYIFISGDRGSKLAGLEDWIPDSAPSSTAFFGVDRSVDTNRLGGIRVDGTGMPIEEALIDGAFDVNREGGAPDYCFVNQNQYRKLVKQLQSRVSYVDVQANAAVGFRGVEIMTGAGSMVVLADRHIRDSRAYMLQLDTWKLASLGPLVHLLDLDGKFLRAATADAYEVRVGSYAQLGCHAPGFNGVVTLD